MNIPKVIVFDRDGTLLDFSDMFLKFILDIHENEQIPPPPIDTILSQKYWQSIISDDLRIGKVKVAESVDRVASHYMEHGKLFPGVREVIQRLQKTGMQMAIVSGWIGTKSTLNFMHKQGLGDCFNLTLTTDDLNTGQGENHLGPGYLSAKKQLLGKALKLLEVKPEDVLIVGDSPEDIEAGKSFNTRVMAVLTGNGQSFRNQIEAMEPHFIVPSVADLATVLNLES